MAEGKYCYEYPRPAVSADCIIIDKTGGHLKILLIERHNEPFKGMWALPGGFIEEDETVDAGAARELKEETGLNVSLEQFRVYSDPERDPRGRIITVAFIAVLENEKLKPRAGDDAKNVKWFSISELPLLAFDHRIILEDALKSL
jgi:8-oxo-dGTP diphosphatase